MHDMFLDIVKMIGTLVLIYAICRALTSGLRSEKARKTVALLAFIPMGLIAVVSIGQSLASQSNSNVALVVLVSGGTALGLVLLLSTKFGGRMLANVAGNAVYDLLKGAFRILLSAGSATRRLFRR